MAAAPKPALERVAIVGVGLIGASFGLALRRAGYMGAIVGVSSPGSIAAALERSAIDRGASLDEAAAKADLIFLSQPISGIVTTLAQLGPLIRPEALVTDAGSTKAVIQATADKHLRPGAFLGGHPMAGKEKRGAEAADPQLFRERPWILTRECERPIEKEFRVWIEALGAKPVLLDAATHDRMVAWSSHLPQLASTALAATLHDNQPSAVQVGGPGLSDMTRLALSSYDLWRDILATNQHEVGAALDLYIAKLQKLRANFEGNFAAGADFARTVRRR